jgi:hypothetical protein
VLALAAWLALPPTSERPFGDHTQLLSAAHAHTAVDLDAPWETRSVVIDSYLDNSPYLPTGTPVGRITLVADNGAQHSWLLRAGLETGEWAARRGDVAALPEFSAPSHWMALVPAGGEFFAQRYRSTWTLDSPSTVARLELERLDDLPPEVTLAIFHLELRR